MITFVRAEVWQSREDRKDLASYLASLPYSDAEKKRIESYPSKFADDAEFINAFINEVGRNRDTVAALKAGTPLPSGNWIHVFHDFREVIATVQAQMFSGVPVAEAALRRLFSPRRGRYCGNAYRKGAKASFRPALSLRRSSESIR